MSYEFVPFQRCHRLPCSRGLSSRILSAPLSYIRSPLRKPHLTLLWLRSVELHEVCPTPRSHSRRKFGASRTCLHIINLGVAIVVDAVDHVSRGRWQQMGARVVMVAANKAEGMNVAMC